MSKLEKAELEQVLTGSQEGSLWKENSLATENRQALLNHSPEELIFPNIAQPLEPIQGEIVSRNHQPTIQEQSRHSTLAQIQSSGVFIENQVETPASHPVQTDEPPNPNYELNYLDPDKTQNQPPPLASIPALPEAVLPCPLNFALDHLSLTVKGTDEIDHSLRGVTFRASYGLNGSPRSISFRGSPRAYQPEIEDKNLKSPYLQGLNRFSVSRKGKELKRPNQGTIPGARYQSRRSLDYANLMTPEKPKRIMEGSKSRGIGKDEPRQLKNAIDRKSWMDLDKQIEKQSPNIPRADLDSAEDQSFPPEQDPIPQTIQVEQPHLLLKDYSEEPSQPPESAQPHSSEQEDQTQRRRNGRGKRKAKLNNRMRYGVEESKGVGEKAAKAAANMARFSGIDALFRESHLTPIAHQTSTPEEFSEGNVFLRMQECINNEDERDEHREESLFGTVEPEFEGDARPEFQIVSSRLRPEEPDLTSLRRPGTNINNRILLASQQSRQTRSTQNSVPRPRAMPMNIEVLANDFVRQQTKEKNQQSLKEIYLRKFTRK